MTDGYSRELVNNVRRAGAKLKGEGKEGIEPGYWADFHSNKLESNKDSDQSLSRVEANMAAVLSHGAVRTGRFLRHEFEETWPVFVFFLIGFLLLFVLIKLVLARFSIEVSAVSNAIVGALFAAKAAMLLNETPLARSLGNYRRIVAVAVKTFIYGLAVLLLGYLERILEAWHKVHGFGGAIEYVASRANHNTILAWSLGISIVFALYFAFFEINQRLGGGELHHLFFDAPAIARDSALLPGITGNRRQP